MLTDFASDLDVEGHPEGIATLEEPGPRRDIALLLPRLEATRIQVTLMAVNGARKDGRSLQAKAALEPSAWRRLAHLLRENDFELVHALGPLAAFYGAIAGRMAHVPTLANVNEIQSFRNLNLFQKNWQRMVNTVIRQGVDKLILPADFLKTGLWRLGFPPERVAVVHPGIELRPKDAPLPCRQELGLPEGPLATMVAPLVPEQGYRTLVEATRKLLERVPDAKIVVVGNGVLGPKLHEQSRLLPILWEGDRSDVREIIASSDVILLHPRHDCLPRVVLEAAGCGKPVVASRVAGISDWVEPGSTGLLVTYEDARDFAVQISRVLTQPRFKQDMGTKTYERAARFSLDIQAHTMTTLYENTIYASR
ncbi:MAG TPA: glycosyltransferase [Aggregatilineales bacterium]|nr:glycosyltransferase [Aggregatilineales bacterium]